MNRKAKKRPRGRPWPDGKPFPEHMNLALARGTFARIDKELAPDQSRNDFIRKAIEFALLPR